LLRSLTMTGRGLARSSRLSRAWRRRGDRPWSPHGGGWSAFSGCDVDIETALAEGLAFCCPLLLSWSVQGWAWSRKCCLGRTDRKKSSCRPFSLHWAGCRQETDTRRRGCLSSKSRCWQGAHADTMMLNHGKVPHPVIAAPYSRYNEAHQRVLR